MQNSVRYPLAAFERYMLLDDQPDFSMTCHIRFWFAGRIDKDRFESALSEALVRHPILTSHLERKTFFLGLCSRHAFVPQPIQVAEVLDWQEGFTAYTPPTIHQNDMRVRFLVRVDHNQTLLAIKFHHATTDGIGIFQFMEDLMLIYDRSFTDSKTLNLPILNPQKLHRRVDFDLRVWDWLRRLHLDLARLGRFFNKWPTPLARLLPKTESNRTADPAAAVRMVVPFSSVSQSQAKAKAAGLTFNDLMIGRLLSTCLEWNRKQGGTVKSWRPFRMNVPISLRTPDEDDMPAANYVSMVFLDRLPNQIDQPDALVRSVADEMSQVKRDRMGLTLIMAVAFMMRIRIFGAILRSSMCMTTVGLTNLGQPFKNFSLTQGDGKVHCGNVTLLGLDTFPPVRRNTLATLSVNRYAGQLSMTARYDSTSWSSTHAAEFLNGYLSSLMDQQEVLRGESGLIVKDPTPIA